MSDLKFSCPSCGQHIQCDEAHAGENIPCPDCAHLVRVPASAKVVVEPPAAVAQPPTAAPDESKVSYTPAEAEKETGAETVPTLDQNFEAGPDASKLSAGPPLTEREEQLAAARAVHTAQASKPVKPRLSFILSGGKAPAREENESALRPEEKISANPDKPHPEIKTLNE